MLDSYLRPRLEKPLSIAAQKLVDLEISANQITLFGFGLGIAACLTIAFQMYTAALIFVLLNRLFDGLDGAVARLTKSSDFGGYCDIVADLIIYTGFVFFFAVGHTGHSLAAAFLLFSYMGTASTFMGFAIIAAKRGIEPPDKKTFYYLGGLAEGTETTIFMVLTCLLPTGFAVFAVIFGVMCWVTALARLWGAAKILR